MKKTTGFSLIELLVVIAIIGILASVVIASLNSSRDKGSDAAIKQDLANLRAQAELFYSNNANTYTTGGSGTPDTLCGDSVFMKAQDAINIQAASPFVCHSSNTAWAASAGLKAAGGYWCVDNTGASGARTTALTSTVCPAS